MVRLVPTYLLNEIDRLLDAEFETCPDAAKDREALKAQLLDYVDEHGVIPEFTLVKNGDQSA